MHTTNPATIEPESGGGVKKIRSAGFILALVWLTAGIAQDASFVGYFSGELDGRQYQVTIDRFNSTTYDGLLQIDDEKMQLDASRYGERFVGLLRNHSGELRFRAELQGSALILEIEDGRRVVLWRGNPQ